MGGTHTKSQPQLGAYHYSIISEAIVIDYIMKGQRKLSQIFFAFILIH